MPRPEQKTVTFTIDGREVQAPEGMMLVDGAKHGDVEIPYFCYEPKLGQPVGACRMCLVEIEGIPKLQTACSTPVKDGMVVHTQTERVREAQKGVVEFLLINHPLDCPVCDKGGECPLQDITFGWGAGTSRFIEPKRHFVKPLELSPLIAIDRERCILCYRCVRFSQEISEDYQLILHERGAHTFVGTFDGHPYVAPFSGNITELCPVGALTTTTYRFRARPWDIEGAGTVCTLCPAQCNVELTVRDERVLRVLARENPDVDDGWLCDKGRFAFQAMQSEERITQPLLRDGGRLRPVTWEQALSAAAAALGRARGGRAAALAGGGATNEEGFLLARLLREGLDCHDLDCRAGACAPEAVRSALAAPARQASVPDLEWADATLVLGCEPVDDAPILDLRLRKGVRRNNLKLAIASTRPSSLDTNAALALRFAPGGEHALLCALDAALAERAGGAGGAVDDLAAAAGADPAALRELAALLGGAADDSDRAPDVAILWGERLLSSADAGRALLSVAERAGAKLIEVPSAANGRGLREAGCVPADGRRDTRAIGEALASGELTTLYLLDSDPLLEQPDRNLWRRALAHAGAVVMHASTLSETVREHATVVFPAEAYPEREGTIVHPDGRLQRLRPGIGRPGEVVPALLVIGELAARLEHPELAAADPTEAFARLAAETPFYAGLTLEEIGGRGVRWPERPQASAAPGGEEPPAALAEPPAAPAANGRLRLATYRPIWAAPEIALAPALRFLHARQLVELSPTDAERLGIGEGDPVEVSAGEPAAAVRGTAKLRSGAPAGTVFLADGLEEQSASALTNGAARLVEVRRA